MTAAIVAAEDARIVGIDGPSLRFLPRLASTVASAHPPITTIADLCQNLLLAYRRAVWCRFSRESTGGYKSPNRFETGGDASAQASDERRQMHRARSLSNSLGAPNRIHLRDAAREQHMVKELSRYVKDGDVVAVVGCDHLEPIATALSGMR